MDFLEKIRERLRRGRISWEKFASAYAGGGFPGKNSRALTLEVDFLEKNRAGLRGGGGEFASAYAVAGFHGKNRGRLPGGVDFLDKIRERLRGGFPG